MYHRFSDPSRLARQCDHLRRHYQPVTMTAVSAWLRGEAVLPPYALAVTIDDGYADFAVAQPVFAKYGIPVTVFLVSDFLDRKQWLWFDRIVYAFRNCKPNDPVIEMPGGTTLRFPLRSDDERRIAGHQLADMAVGFTPAERLDLVNRLPRLLEVEIPTQAPSEYQALTWDQAREFASAGVEFGAHTKTHPILSAIHSAQELQAEIAGSKARIEEQLNRPVLHFCYPNGKMQDIGAAAVESVRTAGMRTAVTAEPGLNEQGQDAFLLNRIGVDPAQEFKYFARRVAGVS